MRFLLSMLLTGAASLAIADLAACSSAAGDATSPPTSADGATSDRTPPGTADGSTDPPPSADVDGCASVPPVFTPRMTPPQPLHAGVCTSGDVEDLVTCILGPQPASAGCASLYKSPALAECFACLVTPDAASKYGPFVFRADLAEFNHAGCIAAVTGDRSAAGCGAQVSALAQCISAVCEDALPCPVSSDAGSCESSARASFCSTYASSATCATALETPGAVAAVCALGDAAHRVSDGIRYGRLFCGAPPPADAGTD